MPKEQLILARPHLQRPKFDSDKEQRYAMKLDGEVQAGEIRGWDDHVKVTLEVNGDFICDYVIDFVVYRLDDSIEYVELKGKLFRQPGLSQLWRFKWKLFNSIFGKLAGVSIRLEE